MKEDAKLGGVFWEGAFYRAPCVVCTAGEGGTVIGVKSLHESHGRVQNAVLLAAEAMMRLEEILEEVPQ